MVRYTSTLVVSKKLSIHQGGKVCLLSSYDAEQLEKYNVVPKCSQHRHCRIADAEEMCATKLLRKINLPGPDRFARLRSQSWRTVYTKLSDIAGAPRLPVRQMIGGS